MSSPFTPHLLELIHHHEADGKPLLLVNARVITGDPLIGQFARGDVLLGGRRIVGIGPGLLTAADDDGAIVIDCAGFVIVPAVLDIAQLTGLRPAGYRPPGAVSPGNPATFAVLPDHEGESDTDTLRRFITIPAAAVAVVTDGRVSRWDGRRIDPDSTTTPTASTAESAPEAATAVPEERLGTWIDENDFVHQHLTADGRYDETRGGREHAFQGSFWITGDRIDYLDDLGFWAFGEFSEDTLHHAGYTFHRA